jgi:hypothetical protein
MTADAEKRIQEPSLIEKEKDAEVVQELAAELHRLLSLLTKALGKKLCRR